jgi:hypothetical protein
MGIYTITTEVVWWIERTNQTESQNASLQCTNLLWDGSLAELMNGLLRVLFTRLANAVKDSRWTPADGSKEYRFM